MAQIGILTMFNDSQNYGCVAQGYALYKYICSMGYDAEIISYSHTKVKRIDSKGNQSLITYFKAHSNNMHLKILNRIEYKIARIICNKTIKNGFSKRREAFERSRASVKTSRVYTDNTICECSKDYDVFISGSDQIWKPGIANDAYLFNFLTEGNKVISYASSTAVECFDSKYDEYMKSSLVKYKWISVREKNAKEHFQELLDREVDLVVDPTLLINRQDWESMAEHVNMDYKYIFVYLLGDDWKQRKAIKQIAKITGLKVVTLPHLGGRPKLCDYGFGDVQLFDIDLSEFLGLIKYSEIVLTDSFHATVFANIFGKQYIVFERNVLNRKDSMNSRLDTLLGMFGENDRKHNSIMSDIDLLNRRIDFEKIHQIIDIESANSGRKLMNHLEA